MPIPTPGFEIISERDSDVDCLGCGIGYCSRESRDHKEADERNSAMTCDDASKITTGLPMQL